MPLPIHSKSLSILVADDDMVMQRLIVTLLKHAGHTGVVVNNGKEALACLAQRQFDVLLLDIMMPEMDGLELLAAIRSEEKKSNRHQKIIMLTGHAEPTDASRLKQAGADGYVIKPINAKQLFDELLRVNT